MSSFIYRGVEIQLVVVSAVLGGKNAPLSAGTAIETEVGGHHQTKE